MQSSTFFGRPRWHLTLAIVFIAQMVTAMGFALVFPFLPLYVEHLGSTTGMSVEVGAGLAIGFQGFTMMVASPFWGAMADRYGRKPMILRTMYGGTLVMGLMAVVTSSEQLIVLRGIQGLITGTVAANNALVAAAVPREKIGFAMGTTQVGLWAGVAAGPIMGGILADQFGYAMPFYITALTLLLSGMLIHIGIEEEFVPYLAESEGGKQSSILTNWVHLFREPGVSMVLITRFLSGVGRTLIVPIAPLFVVSLVAEGSDHQALLAGSVMAVSSATSTVSGVYFGRLGDRIGHRPVFIWTSFAAMLLYIPQVFVTSVWQLLIFQALAGLALGGMTSAPSALLARYTQPGEEGAIYGLDNSIISGSRAAAPIVGSLTALVFGMRGTFAATAVLFAIVWLFTYWYLPQDKIQQPVNAQPAIGD
jgi:DHA1 family multidrug resistance protein-like MFS transporter